MVSNTNKGLSTNSHWQAMRLWDQTSYKLEAGWFPTSAWIYWIRNDKVIKNLNWAELCQEFAKILWNCAQYYHLFLSYTLPTIYPRINQIKQFGIRKSLQRPKNLTVTKNCEPLLDIFVKSMCQRQDGLATSRQLHFQELFPQKKTIWSKKVCFRIHQTPMGVRTAHHGLFTRWF